MPSAGTYDRNYKSRVPNYNIKNISPFQCIIRHAGRNPRLPLPGPGARLHKILGQAAPYRLQAAGK